MQQRKHDRHEARSEVTLPATVWQTLSHAPNDSDPSDIDSTLGTVVRPLSSTRNANSAAPYPSPFSVAALR